MISSILLFHIGMVKLCIYHLVHMHYNICVMKY